RLFTHSTQSRKDGNFDMVTALAQKGHSPQGMKAHQHNTTMKKLSILAASLLSLSAINFAHAWSATGFVFCDANQNQIIDVGDTPLANVEVVVTNTSGTFSNGAFTAADGSFTVELPQDVVDTYIETLVASTLPANSTIVLPVPPAFTFSLPNGDS